MFKEKFGLLAQKITAVKKYLEYSAIIILSLAAGFFVGIKYDHQTMANEYFNSTSPIRESNSSYKFIRPLLSYNLPSAGDESNLKALRSKIVDLAENKKNDKVLSDFSLFMSELNKGRWIGVNETQQYAAASLWKVAIMMAYFKKAQQNKNILDQSFVYTKAMDDLTVPTKYDTPSLLRIGETYKAANLISLMITDSDNGAKTLLLAHIDQASLDSVFHNLTLPSPAATDYVISPKDYSIFFRVLYNGSYLNHKMSEKALALLAQAKFIDGLAAGLPNGAVVAHKFGEHVTSKDGQIVAVELHDCGIVYYKPSPYFICVMTKGPDLDNLKSIIKDVSNLVYQELSKSN